MFSFNIALDGIHLFRTDKMDNRYDKECIESIMLAKFPASEGYSVTRHDYPEYFTSTDLN